MTSSDRVPHDFTYPELNYDSAPNTQPLIKLSFFKKLPEVTYEKFFFHWRTVHADLAAATKNFTVGNVQRYVQFSQPPEMRAQAALLNIPSLDYDACTELWIRSLDDWVRFSRSPEYARFAEDAKHFQQRPMAIMIGYENLIVGRAVPGEVGGRDGIILG